MRGRLSGYPPALSSGHSLECGRSRSLRLRSGNSVSTRASSLSTSQSFSQASRMYVSGTKMMIKSFILRSTFTTTYGAHYLDTMDHFVLTGLSTMVRFQVILHQSDMSLESEHLNRSPHDWRPSLFNSQPIGSTYNNLFYKRECQEKYFCLDRNGETSRDIHPVCVARRSVFQTISSYHLHYQTMDTRQWTELTSGRAAVYPVILMNSAVFSPPQ